MICCPRQTICLPRATTGIDCVKNMEVAIIGGGAAGLMAAYAAAKNGNRVTVYEKNGKCGKKIYITGKGR